MDKERDEKYWDRIVAIIALFIALIGFFMPEDEKNFTRELVLGVGISSMLFVLYFKFHQRRWEKLIGSLHGTTEIKIEELSKNISNLIAIDHKVDEDAQKLIDMSENIYNKRKDLWGKSEKGFKVNNLLRSLVYPASSIYSVTAFVIGKDPKTGKATDMLLMRAQKKDNGDPPPTYQEYDVLGERMPLNAVPHKYAQWLICKYVENYSPEDIKFSELFHKDDLTNLVDLPNKKGKIDDFTYQVPRPFKVQEESNAQSDGSPFFLDFIYVLEVVKDGPNGFLQTDLLAEWVTLEDVLEICKNKECPLRYGKELQKGKYYLKFKSQVLYAEGIVGEYLKGK